LLKRWSDIAVGDEFPNGSVVKSIHEKYDAICYEIKYRKQHGKIGDFGSKRCILAEDHLLLVDIKSMTLAGKQWVRENFTGYSIPTLVDRHLQCNVELKTLKPDENGKNFDLSILHGEALEELSLLEKSLENGKTLEIKDVAVASDLSNVSENEFWLPVRLVVDMINLGEQAMCNGHIMLEGKCVGKRSVFCVETDDHRFETCGLMHHNSVTLRNIILHCLSHGEEVAIALVDLKMTEFEAYKGLKNVVAVANNVRECAEILRVMRECMYARNREMAKLGINDIKDFRPQHPTDEVMIFNHRMKDTDELEIKTVDGEVKMVTVKELEGYLS
jgi:hypothetical protein